MDNSEAERVKHAAEQHGAGEKRAILEAKFKEFQQKQEQKVAIFTRQHGLERRSNETANLQVLRKPE